MSGKDKEEPANVPEKKKKDGHQQTISSSPTLPDWRKGTDEEFGVFGNRICNRLRKLYYLLCFRNVVVFVCFAYVRAVGNKKVRQV